MQASEGECFDKVVLTFSPVDRLAGIDLKDDMAGVPNIGEMAQQLSTWLRAASGD